MTSALIGKFSQNLMKHQHVRFHVHNVSSVKTKCLKRFNPSFGASGKSSIDTVVETKIDDLTITAAKERWLYKALNPGRGQFSFLKLHQELLKGYKNVYIFPKKVQIGKTRLLTMKQLDQFITTSSLLICAPLILYYVREYKARI